MSSHVRKVVGNQQAAFSARSKASKGRREKSNFSPTQISECFAFRQRLSGVLLQGRFVIERIDLTGSPFIMRKMQALALALKWGSCTLAPLILSDAAACLPKNPSWSSMSVEPVRQSHHPFATQILFASVRRGKNSSGPRDCRKKSSRRKLTVPKTARPFADP